MRRMRPALWIVSFFLLVGCAGAAGHVRPADFPRHTTDHPFFDVHWRLDREDGAVQAVGLVEAARVDGVAQVTVELVGLDGSGKVVSRRFGHTLGGHLLQWQVRPFTARLRPTGPEARFVVRVWSFTWEGNRIAAEK